MYFQSGGTGVDVSSVFQATPMSATCSAQRKNNQPCQCLRFMPKNGEDDSGPRRCRDCKHPEGCHPAPQAVATAAPRSTIQDLY